MANDALKEAARKELLRRAAAAELARRQQSQVQKPSGGAGYGIGSEVMDMITAGGQQKLNAAGEGLINAGKNWFTGGEFDYSDQYNRSLEQQRAEQEAWRSENPTQNLLGKGLGIGVGISSLPAIGRGALGAMMTGGAYGGMGGLLQDADSMQERAQNTLTGTGTGAAIGGLLGGAAKAISARPTVSPQKAQQVSILEKEGVQMTAGQKTGSKSLKYAESELGGSKFEDIIEKQGEQFTKAALSKAGINADRATPQVVDKAFTDIGKRFDDLAARNNIYPDPTIAQDLSLVVNDYSSVVPQAMQSKVVFDTVGDVLADLQQGGITGAKYQKLRSRLDRVSRSSADPELKAAIHGIKDALDDGMERSIASNNNMDLGAWKKVRRQYRNLLVIERGVTGAGADAADGLISPPQLRNAAIHKHGRRNFARGKGDFDELANAGVSLLTKMPQSGTAPRQAARNLGQGTATILGSALGGGIGNLPGAIAGGLLGWASPQIAGKVLMSNAMQKLLSGRQSARPGQRAIRAAPIGGLLGSQLNQ